MAGNGDAGVTGAGFLERKPEKEVRFNQGEREGSQERVRDPYPRVGTTGMAFPPVHAHGGCAVCF